MTDAKQKTVITKTGFLYALVLTAVLLWGFSQKFTAPESFLGKLTADTLGLVAYICVITVLGFGVTLVLAALGYPISRTESKDDK